MAGNSPVLQSIGKAVRGRSSALDWDGRRRRLAVNRRFMSYLHLNASYARGLSSILDLSQQPVRHLSLSRTLDYGTDTVLEGGLDSIANQ